MPVCLKYSFNKKFRLMKNLLIFIAVSFLSLTMVGQSEKRNLSDFNSISVSAGIKVYLDNDQKNFADVTVEDTDLDDLVTEVKNNRLTIKWRKNNTGWNKREAEVVLHYTQIERIDASSGCIIKTDDLLEANNLNISSSSGAIVELQIKANDLSVSASSGTIVTISGSANAQDIDISSGAMYKGKELASKSSEVDGSSGAIAVVHVTEELKADVSSGAVIKYKGDPKYKDLDDDKWSGGVIRKM